MPSISTPAPHPPEPAVGIVDVEIEQDDLDVVFVISFTDGTVIRRKAKLPKQDKDALPPSWWIRGGMGNASSGVQQVYVIELADPAPTYAGKPLIVFRKTAVPDTYTMEIIVS